MSTETVRADQIRPGDQIDTPHVANWGVASVEHAHDLSTLTMNTGTRLTFAPDETVKRRTFITDPAVVEATIRRDFPRAVFFGSLDEARRTLAGGARVYGWYQDQIVSLPTDARLRDAWPTLARVWAPHTTTDDLIRKA